MHSDLRTQSSHNIEFSSEEDDDGNADDAKASKAAAGAHKSAPPDAAAVSESSDSLAPPPHLLARPRVSMPSYSARVRYARGTGGAPSSASAAAALWARVSVALKQTLESPSVQGDALCLGCGCGACR